MEEFIVPFLLGIACIILGISNMRGNIKSLHFYHRRRVSEENRIPFGKMVGRGTIIVGAAIMLNSVLSAVASYTKADELVFIGSVVMILGLVLGIGMSFYAMIKYNKGIF